VACPPRTCGSREEKGGAGGGLVCQRALLPGAGGVAPLAGAGGLQGARHPQLELQPVRPAGWRACSSWERGDALHACTRSSCAAAACMHGAQAWQACTCYARMQLMQPRTHTRVQACVHACMHAHVQARRSAFPPHLVVQA